MYKNEIDLLDEDEDRSEKSNLHVINSDLKIHTVVTDELDYCHEISLSRPLGEVSDEQLVAEIAHRRLNVTSYLKSNHPLDNEKHNPVLSIVLSQVSDNGLFDEVTRRRLDLRDKINEALVYETYQMGKLLGVGASGKVYQVTNKLTQKEFACKVIKKDANINDAQSMSTEIEIMKRIRHRNIVSMYELYTAPKQLWMILELIDSGDLRSYLNKNKSHYNEKMKAFHMKQILSGVHYLHSMGVIHRDIKLENILLKKNGDVYDAKIADFGLSALVRLGENGYDLQYSSKRKKFTGLHEPWGTAEYESPELLDGAYGPQADVWAVGCLLYEMLTYRKAFAPRPGEKTLEFMYQRIKQGSVDYKSPIWKVISEDAKALVQGLLRVDPKKRLSASEAKKHKWISTHVPPEIRTNGMRSENSVCSSASLNAVNITENAAMMYSAQQRLEDL